MIIKVAQLCRTHYVSGAVSEVYRNRLGYFPDLPCSEPYTMSLFYKCKIEALGN